MSTVLSVLTCISVRLRFEASAALSVLLRYLFISNVDSSWNTWLLENTVRVFFFLAGSLLDSDDPDSWDLLRSWLPVRDSGLPGLDSESSSRSSSISISMDSSGSSGSLVVASGWFWMRGGEWESLCVWGWVGLWELRGWWVPWCSGEDWCGWLWAWWCGWCAGCGCDGVGCSFSGVTWCGSRDLCTCPALWGETPTAGVVTPGVLLVLLLEGASLTRGERLLGGWRLLELLEPCAAGWEGPSKAEGGSGKHAPVRKMFYFYFFKGQ